MQVFYSGMVFLLMVNLWAPAPSTTHHSDLEKKENFAAEADVLYPPYPLESASRLFTEQLACQDTTIVKLDVNCQKTITADELLEGDLQNLRPSDFLIEILDENVSNKNVVDGPGVHIFRISLKKQLLVQGPVRWLAPAHWSTSGDPISVVDNELKIPGGVAQLQLPLAGSLKFKAYSDSNYSLQWLNPEGSLITEEQVEAGIEKEIDFSFDPGTILRINTGDDSPAALFLKALIYEAEADPAILGFENCAGYIKAEDKTPPVLDCREEIRSGAFTKEVQLIDGVVSSEDPSVAIMEDKCAAWPAGQHLFDTLAFEVSQTGWYSFELEASWGKGFGALYQKTFDAGAPCDHLIAIANYPNNELGYFKKTESARVYVYLKPEQTYILLTRSQAGDGSFQWAVFSDGEAYIKGFERFEAEVCFPLLCGDVGKVLNQKESLQWLGSPAGVEDCSNYKVSFTDELLSGEKCSEVVARRRIEAEDDWGNVGNCEQKLIFDGPGENEILPPARQVYISCDEFFVMDDNGHPHPSTTGYPGVLSPFGIRSLRLQECNWVVTYFDEKKAGHCPGNTEITRHWQIMDWCDPDRVIAFKQKIVIGDFKGPGFDVNLPERKYLGEGRDTFVVSTGPFDCHTTLPIPAPVNITDNCSETVSVKALLKNLAGDTLALKAIEGKEVFFNDIGEGEYRLTYILTDACLNESKKEIVLFVRDLIAPVAICNEDFNISIGGDGIGRVAKEDVTEGSWDACTGEPELKVRREVPESCLEEFTSLTGLTVTKDTLSGVYYTPWADQLYFTCCDMQEEVRIELRVTDKNGNVDLCWQKVRIEDKIPPKCIAPPSDTLDCTDYAVTDYTDSLELQRLFGVPEVVDEHCPTRWVEFPAVWQEDECNEGLLTRKFMAIDASGNRSDTCYQYILVKKVHNYEIKFPRDVQSYKCIEPLQDTLETNVLGCDVLAIRKDTIIYTPDDEECGQWHIVHQVINWCEIKGNPIPVGVSRNEDADDMIGEDDVYVLVRPDGKAYIDDNNDETDGFLREVSSTGFWEYTQIIEILDTIQPNIIPDNHEPFCTYDSDCIGRVDFFFTVFDFCSRNNLTITVYYDENDDGTDDERVGDDQVLGRVPKFRVRGDYPTGDHSFRIEVTDGCGNTVRTRHPFSVVDCKAPAPVCVEQLAVELMPVYPPEDVDGDGDEDPGMNVVWASDFKPLNRFEDCSEEIRYSIHRVGDIAHPDSTNLVITCDDPDVLEVRIYAWDNAYNPLKMQPDSTLGGPNYDYCTAFIDVQDNRFDLCNGGITTNVVSGKINSREGVPLPGVKVGLSGGEERTTESNPTGAFVFADVQTGYDYTLSPEYNLDPMDGVTTFDLVLMSKYILGISDFESPYQYIAADINRSGTISTLDLIHLRKMILNIDDEFPNNSSWRFVDATHPFDPSADEWLSHIPEYININNFDPFSETSYDFVAVKTGDLNNSNSILKRGLDSEERMALQPEDLFYKLTPSENGTLAVDLFAGSLSILDGFQFTLEFDTERFELIAADTKAGILGKQNIGRKLIEEGLLAVSWNAMGESSFSTDTPLMQLRFKALAPLASAEPPIRIGSRLLAAEAYDKQGRIHPIRLIMKKDDQTAFSLAGAVPNPFKEQTEISFFLPSQDRVSIDVVDYNGRKIWSREQYFEAGRRQFWINDRDLAGPGLYFYTLNNGKQVRTGKLVLVH